MIDRRSLLKNGALAGAAATLAGRSAAEAAAVAPPSLPSLTVPAFELDELTVVDLQKRMASGVDSAKTLCEKYIARIEAVDRGGPALRAVLEINPDALAIAAGLDAERKAGKVRGPLHGIPVLIKDNVGTADRMQTTAGSLALVGAIPAADAAIVKRLRDAGAVILGKTNLSEWANFRSTHSSSGWSGRGGQCRNPYALDRDPSGSSSGSGAAAAASLCAVTVGTETDGSIVSPSNNCALVGFKPTLGLVSRTGIIPIAHSQDTAGPMTRTVADAAALLSAMCGFDPADPTTRDLAGKAPVDYTAFLDRKGLAGKRIGVPRKKLYGQSPAADAVAEAALDAMRREGAIIVDPADIATLGDTDDSEFEVLLYEFKANLNLYLAGLGNRTPYRTLKDLIVFNQKNRESEMPYFGQEIFEKAEAKGPLTEKTYLDALAKDVRLTRAEGIDKTMDEHRLDCLVAPTSAPASLIDLVNGSYGPGGSSSFPAIAGYPDVTVPAGWSFGLPVGLSFFGRAGSEPTLFKIAYAFEQATKARKPPRFLPTAELTPKAS
jgi:amidase